MHYLSNILWFPEAEEATEEGLLALGGDLSPKRLVLAYHSGIFPWYSAGDPILWWSPDPRMVLFPSELKVSKSLQKTIKKELFRVTYNTSFKEVITQCAQRKRKGQEGTWITQEMLEAYCELHALGHAISIEVWQDKQLVGGLYGVDLPDRKVFCGESMFSTRSDASKVGFCFLVDLLKEKGYGLIDCQIHNDHLESMGAREISRADFLTYL